MKILAVVSTEPENMACTWLGEILLLFSAQEQISPNHVQAIFSGSVHGTALVAVHLVNKMWFDMDVVGVYCA